MNDRIRELTAWQVLDSRGDPTVAARVTLESGATAKAIAPAGASAGSHEALFMRDGGDDFGGRSVSAHLRSVLPVVQDAVLGVSVGDPQNLENSLRAADGTAQWTRIGGNVSTAVSVAAWLACSEHEDAEPWELIAQWTGANPVLPVPMVNIISGGAHAGSAVDIQDVLAMPSSANSIEEAIHCAWAVRRGTRELMEKAGYQTALIADEGGLAASFPQNDSAIQAVFDGAIHAGYGVGTDVVLALDIAANEFMTADRNYRIEGQMVTSAQLVALISSWCDHWSVASVEDPLSEDDDWSLLADLTRRVRVVGDDRYATSQERLARGVSASEANTILIKPNQAGSLWATIQTLQHARSAGWHTIVSARSGETEETWLVDLAVGSGAGQIKVGSTMRSERTAKWNRLFELSHLTSLRYAGLW